MWKPHTINYVDGQAGMIKPGCGNNFFHFMAYFIIFNRFLHNICIHFIPSTQARYTTVQFLVVGGFMYIRTQAYTHSLAVSDV